MKIISIHEANQNYKNYLNRVLEEANEIAADINAAILAADENNASNWEILDHRTNRVVYIDVTGRLEDVIRTVIEGLRSNRYVVNRLSIGTDDGIMSLLAIIWDPAVVNNTEMLEAMMHLRELGVGEDGEDDCGGEGTPDMSTLAAMLSDLGKMCSEMETEDTESTDTEDVGFKEETLNPPVVSENDLLRGNVFDIPDEEQGGEELAPVSEGAFGVSEV